MFTFQSRITKTNKQTKKKSELANKTKFHEGMSENFLPYLHQVAYVRISQLKILCNRAIARNIPQRKKSPI